MSRDLKKSCEVCHSCIVDSIGRVRQDGYVCKINMILGVKGILTCTDCTNRVANDDTVLSIKKIISKR